MIMMKSIYFLAGCMIITCIMHVSVGRREARKKGPKILILGAGMSGISAAKTLHDHGYTNIEILEGSNRVGGRIKSINLSGYTIELGAQWIYGAGTNPIMKLASEYNLAHKQNPGTWTLRDALGTDLTERGEDEYEKFEKALGNLNDFATTMVNGGFFDMTAEALLRFGGWRPDNIVADAVEVFAIDIENGIETPSVSGKYLNKSKHGDGNWFVVNDARGYVILVEKMKESFLPKDDKRLFFNKKVTQIENWDSNKIKVYSEDGTLFEADYVIVTFSLGVLQSRNVIFKPLLPKWKLLAIDKFGFGHNTVMYFKFNSAFWDSTSWIIHVPAIHGEQCVWFNMNYVFPGCNILQLTLGGTEAKAAERTDDSELIAKAMQVLRAMYPQANISEPESFVTTRWISDPLTLGTFSYWPPSFTLEDMNDLGHRIGHIYFAGEHINKTSHGVVHNAYTSGINTALDLMACIEDKSLCKHRVALKDSGGTEAKAADRTDDSEVIAKALQVLRAMYPLANISAPESFVTTRRMSDPLTFGTFSYWPPSFTLEDMNDLGHRIGHLYFAGEHINKTSQGFVHSAYTSGINTALDLMACIEDNSLCIHRVATKDTGKACESDSNSGRYRSGSYRMAQYQNRLGVLLIIVTTLI